MSGRVCAVVVTYNRRGVLRECLLALEDQTRPPDAILVVDNASDDDTGAMVRAEFPRADTLALARNLGGAGGFHAGIAWASAHEFDWLWVMDDDGRPAPDCLAQLLARARPDAIPVPLQVDSGGRRYGFVAWRGRNVNVTEAVVDRGEAVGPSRLFAFVGPLIPRALVERVGLPNKDFFILLDDWEYALRLQRRADAEIVFVPEAVLFHDEGGETREVRFLGRRSIRLTAPAWKTYYRARNHLYMVARTRQHPAELLLYGLLQARLLVMDALYESDRWARARLRLRGIRDGALGRLGPRVAPRSTP